MAQAGCTPCSKALYCGGDLCGNGFSTAMEHGILRELQSGKESIRKLESKFKMVMTDLFEDELLSIFQLQDPYSIFSDKLKSQMVGSVSEGFGLPEYLELDNDGSSTVWRDEADFNLVWGSLKLGESSATCELDGVVQFSSQFPGYASVKLVKEEAITRLVDLSNIAMSSDGSQVEIFLHPSAVTDEFYMSLRLRSVLSTLITNSVFLDDRNFEKGIDSLGNDNEHAESKENQEMSECCNDTKRKEGFVSGDFMEDRTDDVSWRPKVIFLVDQGGPAVNVTLLLQEGGGITFDMALCLAVPGWPSVANDWITRQRPGCWPDWKLVSSVVKEGCGLVPVSPLESQTGLEWRISFSLCERKLAQSLSDCQKGCYLTVKAIWRHYLKHPSKCGLQSYHLKTATFWVCEETHPSDWTREKSTLGVLRILQKLYCFLVNMTCPHFFIPEHNLFENIEKGVLLTTLQRVSIAIISRQQIWYNNPALLSTLPPVHSRMHFNKLEDVSFRKAIENVYSYYFDLAGHQYSNWPTNDLEEMMAYNVREALENCFTSQVSRHVIGLFFVAFESALHQKYSITSSDMRRYISARITPHMIATRKPIPWDPFIKLCAWLDMFKFGFRLFVHFVNQEELKPVLEQNNSEESDTSEQEMEDESDGEYDVADYMIQSLSQTFKGNGEFEAMMDMDDGRKEEVET
ncbi:uncharacterized protein [Montipora foliosa]|uniref:uncharacterized protein n=1 Tax=Montipora foliosa TaxID=591990 RepID=UPI0035F17AEB